MVKRKARTKRCRFFPQLDNFIRILFCYALNECRVASENVSPFKISDKLEERVQFEDSWEEESERLAQGASWPRRVLRRTEFKGQFRYACFRTHENEKSCAMKIRLPLVHLTMVLERGEVGQNWCRLRCQKEQILNGTFTHDPAWNGRHMTPDDGQILR